MVLLNVFTHTTHTHSCKGTNPNVCKELQYSKLNMSADASAGGLLSIWLYPSQPGARAAVRCFILYFTHSRSLLTNRRSPPPEGILIWAFLLHCWNPTQTTTYVKRKHAHVANQSFHVGSNLNVCQGEAQTDIIQRNNDMATAELWRFHNTKVKSKQNEHLVKGEERTHDCNRQWNQTGSNTSAAPRHRPHRPAHNRKSHPVTWHSENEPTCCSCRKWWVQTNSINRVCAVYTTLTENKRHFFLKPPEIESNRNKRTHVAVCVSCLGCRRLFRQVSVDS